MLEIFSGYSNKGSKINFVYGILLKFFLNRNIVTRFRTDFRNLL